MLSPDTSILIIGTLTQIYRGTFGISTAYHLAKRGYKNITAIDRNLCPSVDSAGYDLNKIVRTEYDDDFYTKMALEALEKWRAPEFAGIFHETGRLTTTNGNQAALDHLRQSHQNLQSAGQADRARLVSGRAEIVSLIPQLSGAVGLDSWTGLFNAQGGWVHARKALEKWAAAASLMGVSFISGPRGTMTGLEVSDGKIVGVRTQAGDVLTADQYILCTGAASPELLPELAPQLWSKCWTVGHIELSEEEAREWRGIPVIDHFELGFAFEPDGEFRRIKICDNTPGYQNCTATYTDASGSKVPYSVPRYASTHPSDGIPAESAAGIRAYIDTVMPQFSGRPLVDTKVCWCTDSPDAHFLIDRHPKYAELLLATGDSGHAFKMFPVIGDYIGDALEGKERGLKQEWKFGGRKGKPVAMRPDTEVKDLRDVL
ncbi:hypothetical protein TD95_005051 [Thielaviopsis punctulata]|uniref:FAD dependent oxidoreductase domain-containing protein n=1 Tax=Thielaviopsis punctulata TaxID=72032 RepID=A0A0F4Z828_9PEZI|nr:hypothetical protein TD95_005051 [Thielaviopsis punctulata]